MDCFASLAMTESYLISVSLGYKLQHGFRIEGELGYSQYSVASASPQSTNGAFPALNGNRLSLQSGGSRDDYSATANAFYDFPISEQVVPFTGVSFGIENADAETSRFAGAGGTPKFTGVGSNKAFFAMLGEVGVRIKLDKSWSVAPSYCFEHLFIAGSKFPDQADIVKLGLIYSL